MQGSEENLLSSTHNLFVFKGKLNIRTRYVKEHKLEMFLLNAKANYKEIINLIIETVELLKTKIEHYFPSLDRKIYLWVRDSLATKNCSSLQLNLEEEEDLAEIRSNHSLEIQFKNNNNVGQLWTQIKNDFPNISVRAIRIRLQFSTSFLLVRSRIFCIERN